MINNSDIYNISDFVNKIQKKYIENETDETLSMGIFGYLNDIHSSSIQNAIINAAEWGNEAIPTKSKFEKTILTNAITYDIQDLNAVPSKMQIMMGFMKKEIDEQMDLHNKPFYIKKESKIYIEDFEFHLDYDIVINRSLTKDNEYAYSARYIIDRENPLSDVINPYLQAPFIIRENNSSWIFLTTMIRQVEFKNEYKKIISRNILENKTFEFKFQNQLATFEIEVTEEGKTKFITPIFEGMPSDSEIDYCYYTYLDGSTIRVKFDRDSYQPKLNADVNVHVKTTRGSEGNFKYKEDIITTLESNESYKTINTLIRPVTDSMMGIDRKTVKQLKQMIPKEILSRGNIINNKDLENFFNMIDDNNKIYLFRKRDNQIERLYYAYLIAKNNINNIVPTNTLDLRINQSDFDIINDERFIINPGRVFRIGEIYGYLNPKDEEINISELEKKEFIYSSPFLIVVNKNPLSTSYYLTNINRKYEFNFSYINDTSEIQFITHNITMYKNYLEGNDYILNTTILQNINIDRNLIELDSEGNIIKCEVIPVLIIEKGSYKYYTFGKVISVDGKNYGYNIEFRLETDNIINRDNEIMIKNMYLNGTDVKDDIPFDEKVKMQMAVFIPKNQSSNVNDSYVTIPSLEKNYMLINRYKITEDVNMFYNYSHLMNSIVLLKNPNEGNLSFEIRSVPLVKYSYIYDIDRCNELIDFIQYRKAYMDTALNVLENSFGIDFKFFNTYGPSKLFTIGHNKDGLDRVNIKMVFKIKTVTGADKKIRDYIIRDIKEYMENINNLTDLHMSNLTTYIKNNYKSDLEFIEFVRINEYDSTFQYVEREEAEIIQDVPEFLTIDLPDNVNPDIEIINV